MLPKAPDAELRRDADPLVEALFNWQLLHIEAYVVHVDMVSQHEVAFKLTPETIEALVEYHKDIYSKDIAANVYSWPEKEAQLKKLQEEFEQAANRFVFRTDARALEGLEEDGAGELLEGHAAVCKEQINGMFQDLLPPPPRIVDVIHPAPQLLPNTTMAGGWWAPAPMLPSNPVPVDTWKVLPSTPSPTATTCSSDNPSTSIWPDLSMYQTQLPSPTPSFSQPVYTSAPSQFYSSPQSMAPMPAIQLPSQLTSHCGADMSLGGFNDFGWSTSSFPSHFATAV